MYDHLHNKIKEEALHKFPEEMCGIIVNNDFIPCKNVSKEPLNNFIIHNNEIAKYTKDSPLLAVIHSHSKTSLEQNSAPSKEDMIGQISSGVSWAIIDTDGINVSKIYWWGDHILDEGLIGKEFQHGINDCYSLIRKFYYQRMNIKIPEFPRDDNWWTNGNNLYVEGFKKAGFYCINKEELKNGDVILGKVKSKIINHGGIYLDNKEDGKGLIIHHLPNRLSRREPALPWINRADLFLRHKDVT